MWPRKRQYSTQKKARIHQRWVVKSLQRLKKEKWKPKTKPVLLLQKTCQISRRKSTKLALPVHPVRPTLLADPFKGTVPTLVPTLARISPQARTPGSLPRYPHRNLDHQDCNHSQDHREYSSSQVPLASNNSIQTPTRNPVLATMGKTTNPVS